MRRMFIPALVLLTVLGCAAQESKDKADKPTSGTKAAAAQTSAKTATTSATAKAAKAAPKLGPKANSTSYAQTPAGKVFGDKLSLFHLSAGGGRLQTESAPKEIVFTLSSKGLDGAYPVVTKLVLIGPGEKEGKVLDQKITVKGEVTKQYTIKDGKPGLYHFQIWYGGVDKKIKGRPVLTVDSVELK